MEAHRGHVVAVIDLGSNSVRLVVAESTDGTFRKLTHSSQVLKLILSVSPQGLPEEVERELLKTLRRHAERARELGAERLVIIGTEVLRKLPSSYRLELIRRIHDQLSDLFSEIRVEVLTESDEARYAFIAVMDLAQRFSAVIDIGGGSMDVILPYLSYYQSLKLGTWRLKEILDYSGPSTLKDKILTAIHLTGIYHVLRHEEEPLMFMGGNPVEIAHLMLRPGDLTSFFEQDYYRLRLSQLRTLSEELSSLSPDELRSMLLEPARAPTLLPTLMAMIVLSELLGFNEVLITPKSIIDGVLREEFAKDESVLTPVLLSMLCTNDSLTNVHKFINRVLTNLTRSGRYLLLIYDPIDRSLKTFKDDGARDSALTLPSSALNRLLTLPFHLDLTDSWKEFLKGTLPLDALKIDLEGYSTLIRLDLGTNFLGLLFLETTSRSQDRQYLFIAKQLLSNYLMMTALYKASMIDPLTNIYNRRYLFDKLLEEVKRSARYKLPLSIVLMDIDGFKGINDQFGHVVGDQALKEVSRFIAEHTRRGIDVVARYGGDELMLLLPHTPVEGAIKCCFRLASEISSMKFTQMKLRLRTSWGISQYFPKDTLNYKDPPDYQAIKDRLIHQADMAMYHAKRISSWEPSQKVFVWDDELSKPVPSNVLLARTRR